MSVVETTPKAVLGFLFDQERSFVHIRVTMKNSRGSLEKVLHVLTGLKVNVLSSFSNVAPGEKTGEWSAFAELAAETTPEAVVTALKATEGVIDAEIHLSEDGLLIESSHFPVLVGPGERVLLLPPEMLSGMFAKIKRTFGSGGETILYLQGKAAGVKGAGITIRDLGKERQRSLRDTSMPFVQTLGWGRARVLEHSEDFTRVKVSVTDCFECVGVRSTAMSCSFIRGVVAGVFSGMTNKQLEAEETSCVAAGAAACTFEIGERS